MFLFCACFGVVFIIYNGPKLRVEGLSPAPKCKRPLCALRREYKWDRLCSVCHLLCICQKEEFKNNNESSKGIVYPQESVSRERALKRRTILNLMLIV